MVQKSRRFSVTPHILKYSPNQLDRYRCLSESRTDTNVAKFSAVRLVKEPKEILRFKTKWRSDLSA